VIARLSLRARLVLGVIVLAAVGLATADVATYASLRSFLIDRTDMTLADSGDRGRGPHHDDCHEGRAPPGSSGASFTQVRTLDGQVLCSSDGTSSPPLLPETIAPGSFTVPSQDGGSRYRVRASVEPGSNTISIAATSLADVDGTLHRLLLIELMVTAAVLTGLGVLGLWVVRLGLRPLGAIEATAAGIAAGDLSRRVERAEERTEVGRLGLALNAMLAQIEAAFTAQAASERKLRRFVADASHELRTPLAAVRAYAELFERGADRRPEDLERSMTGITRESERMSLLVDDLLLLARLDEGRPLERDPVRLEQVVGEAVETALTVDPDRPIALDAARVNVVGDRDRLRQIVDNLLGNVRAHTPARAPVRVRVGRLNGSAFIEVADSGPGLTIEQSERVFERFYRADPSRSRGTGGVGLGLSIVAAVARAHGGKATAASAPGRGASFRITLPAAHSQESAMVAPSPWMA
jgi:two-component system OmpR family sensor kinase